MFGPRCRGFLMEGRFNIDIDVESDFELAEAIMFSGFGK